MGKRICLGGLLIVAALALSGCEALLGTQSGGPTPFAFPTAVPAIFEVATLPPGGSVGGRVWHDLCSVWGTTEAIAPAGCAEDPRGGYRANGLPDSGEPGIAGVVLRLAEGLCPGSPSTQTTTDAQGGYRFSGVVPGSYCVSLDPADGSNGAILLPGGWTYPLGIDGMTSISVAIASDEAALELSFGWDYELLPIALGPLPSATVSPTATPSPTASVSPTTTATRTPTRTSTPSSFADWKGEYFANQNLSGTPALVRNDKDLDFEWGSGTPAPGLPADHFSVRWTRKLDFSAGTYRFTVRADDGVRLYVDGTRILNEWHDNSGDEAYSVDRALDGKRTILVEYYENTKDALLELSWKKLPTPTPTHTAPPTIGPSNTPTATPTPTDTPLVPSDTPTPTDTPLVPSDTPTPTDTPLVPTDTPTPA